MRPLLKVPSLKLINILLVLAFCALPFQPIAAKNINSTPPSVSERVTIPPRPDFTPQQSSPTGDRPDEPVYVATSGRVARAYNFNDLGQTPSWEPITPALSEIGGIYDFALDPFRPDEVAYVSAVNGIYVTDSLADPSPTWNSVPASTLQSTYISLEPDSGCTVGSPDRILTNKYIPGNVVIIFTSFGPWNSLSPINWCDRLVAISHDYGTSWNYSAIPSCQSVTGGFPFPTWYNNCRFSGAAAFGNSDLLYVLEMGNVGQNATLFTRVSQDGGNSWTEPAYYKENTSGTDYHASYAAVYPSVYNPQKLIMAPRDGESIRLLTTETGGKDNDTESNQGDVWHGVNFPPTDEVWPNTPKYYPIPGYIRDPLWAFVNQNGDEFIATIQYQKIFYSTDFGQSWILLGLVPWSKGSVLAINPDNFDYRVAARLPTDSCDLPYPPWCHYGPYIQLWDGTQWYNRIGNWYSTFESNWAHGAVRVTAPSFVRRTTPEVARSAVAGDDWDRTSMLANTAYQTQVQVGGPVNTWTGQYMYSSTDFTVQAQGQPLSFHRAYSTSRLEWFKNKPEDAWRDEDPVLGPGWTHNFNIRLFLYPDETDPTKIVFQMANGSSMDFEKQPDGSYKAPTGLLAEIRKLYSGGWGIIMLSDRTRYVFNAKGRVIRIDQLKTTALTHEPFDSVFGDGPYGIFPITLTYQNGDDGHLVNISSGDRYIHFVYDAGTSDPATARDDRLTAVCVTTILPGTSDPCPAPSASQTLPSIGFTYTATTPDALETGVVHRLPTTVTDARNQSWTYLWRVATFPEYYPLLASVTDPSSKLVERQALENLVTHNPLLPGDCHETQLWNCRVTEQYKAATSNPEDVIVKLNYTHAANAPDGLTEITDARGNKQKFHYVGGVLQIIQFDYGASMGLTHQTGFNGQYLLEFQTDARGNLTTKHWEDPRGLRVIEQIDALGHTSSYGYVSATDMLDNRPSSIKDSRNNQSQVAYTDGVLLRFPTEFTDASGVITRLTYDESGRVKISERGSGGSFIQTGYCYNERGLPSKTITNLVGSDPCTVTQGSNQNHITSYEYDDAGRPFKITDPQGRLTWMKYNAAGDIEQMTRNATLNAQQQPEPFDPATPDHNLTTTFKYDTAGRLEYVIDWRKAVDSTLTTTPEVRVTRLEYDALGRLAKEIRNLVNGTADPNDRDVDLISEYSYDAAGNRIYTKGVDGRVTWTCYDPFNRPALTVVNSTDTAKPYTEYNPETKKYCEYAATGATTTADANKVTRVEYDEVGNVKLLQSLTPGYEDTAGVGWNPQRHDTWTCYDELNRPTRSIFNPTSFDYTAFCDDAVYAHLQRAAGDPDQNHVNMYEYDVAGNRILTSYNAVTPTGAPAPTANLAWTCYDAANRPVLNLQNSTFSEEPFLQIGANGSSCNVPGNLTDAPDFDLLAQTVYDNYGRVWKQFDPLNRETRTLYDNFDRVTAQFTNYADGVFVNTIPDKDILTTIDYYLPGGVPGIPPDGSARDVIDELGRKTRTIYDALDHPVTIIRNVTGSGTQTTTENVTTTYTYDAWGNVKTQVDPNNHTTTFAYDKLNRLTTVTDALGKSSYTAYDVVGNVIATADPTGHYMSFGYDGLNRRTVSRAYVGFWVTPSSILTNPTQSGGTELTTVMAYDVIGRSMTITDPENVATKFEYNEVGDIKTVFEHFVEGQAVNSNETPDQNVKVEYLYDKLSNLTTMILPPGKTTGVATFTYEHDALNRRTTVNGPLAASGGFDDIWRTYYDKGGRVVAQDMPNDSNEPFPVQTGGEVTGASQVMHYDALDRPLGITYPLATGEQTPGNVTFEYTPDTANKRHQIAMTTADLGATTRVFDPLDRLMSVTDPHSQTVTYGYDAGGRQTAVTMPGSRTTGYAYTNRDELCAVYNGTAADCEGGSAQYDYDDTGRLKTITLPGGVTVGLDYDTAGRTTLVHYQKGPQTLAKYEYQTFDEVGNRKTVKETLAKVDVPALDPNRQRLRLVAICSSSPSNHRTWRVSNPNNDNIAFTWKVIGTSQEGTGVVAANGEAIFQTPTQGEANALNTVRIFTDTSGTADDTRVSSPVTCGGPEATATPLSTITSERTITYTYDSLYRLKQASYDESGVVKTYNYEYDLRSNRVSAQAPGQSAVTYGYNLANQLNGYTYDHNGNLTNDGVNTYVFDAANRLRQVTQAGTNTAFTYDGEGNRLKLNYTGPDANYETDYLLDLSGSLSTTLREQQGSAQTWYLNGLDVIGQETASGWTYFGYDGLGSVRHLMDATGQIIYRADYDPYGVPVPIAVQPGASTTTLGFTGEQTDPTGLLYLRARYMNPQTGMFLSGDPVEGIFGRSASRNGYGYVEGNPANYVDPSGKILWAFVFAGVAKALIGGAIGAGALATAAVANDIRGQVWHNQIYNGMSFGEAFNNIDRGSLIRSATGAAEFGFMLGMGFGTGGLLNTLRLTGVKAFAAGAAADVGLGMAWDMAAHHDDLGSAFASNLIGFGAGEVLGAVGKRGLRAALSMGRDVLSGLPIRRMVGSGVCSFSADTLVATEDGEKPIRDIQVGEKVLAYDEDSKTTGEFAVTAIHKHDDPVIVHLTIDGEQIETTPEHPFYVKDRGWVPAGELKVGDFVRRANGLYGAVKKVETEQLKQMMYNLTVDDAHTFFVGESQWLVHNDCADSRLRLLFGQARAAPTFSTRELNANIPEEIAGKDLREVAQLLKEGRIDPNTLRIQYFEHEGQFITANNRGLAALSLAEMYPTNTELVSETQAWLRRLEQSLRLPGNAIQLPRKGSIELPYIIKPPSEYIAITTGKSGTAFDDILYFVGIPK